MRQISNEFMVLSQQDARDILAAAVGSAHLSDEQLKALTRFVEGHGSRHFYSASQLLTQSHADPRLRYAAALREEIKTLRSCDEEAHLLEQTKSLMTPTWSRSGRVAAVMRVREIAGMGLTEAARWVDLHYQKP